MHVGACVFEQRDPLPPSEGGDKGAHRQRKTYIRRRQYIRLHTGLSRHAAAAASAS
jgi:hypothetical protein